MRQTSLEAYFSIQKGGSLGNKQKMVLFKLMELGQATNKQLARALGWEINRITGRVKELFDQNKIIEAGTIIDPETRKSNTIWRPNAKSDTAPSREPGI